MEMLYEGMFKICSEDSNLGITDMRMLDETVFFFFFFFEAVHITWFIYTRAWSQQNATEKPRKRQEMRRSSLLGKF